MKILQVNCVYKKGSTGKIVFDIHSELVKKGIESVVCYGRGDKIIEPNVYKTCGELYSKMNNLWSRFTGLMYGGCGLSTNKLIKIIKKENPNVVHLHCINGYFVNIYRLVNWLKKSGIKTILTLHAEFMYTANCGYSFECEKWKTGCGKCPRNKTETKSLFFDRTHSSWLKMKKAFDGFNNLTVIAVSDWISKRATQSPIFEGIAIKTIYNGINLDSFTPVEQEQDEEIVQKYGISMDKKIILHVTPSFDNPIKGGKHFVDLSRALGEDYQCVIVGAKAQIEGIVTIPFTTNQKELASLYRKASVFVITSKADNYPTVCLEANSCGTPVVGFDVGGVKDTIYTNMGTVVDFGNVEQVKEKVEEWTNKTISKETIDGCREKNSRERMAEDYIKLYMSL